MPRRDGTGPRGSGMMTGRKAGFCAGNDVPGLTDPTIRLGLRRGYNGGRGWRHQYYATGRTAGMLPNDTYPSPEQELAGLKNDAEWLKTQLEAINQRMEELKPEE